MVEFPCANQPNTIAIEMLPEESELFHMHRRDSVLFVLGEVIESLEDYSYE